MKEVLQITTSTSNGDYACPREHAANAQCINTLASVASTKMHNYNVVIFKTNLERILLHSSMMNIIF